MQSAIESSKTDIRSKITQFKATNSIAPWNTMNENDFFKIINTVDSIKDGANTQLAEQVFNDGNPTGITPDDFKSAVKQLFGGGVSTNTIIKIPYSRIKGGKNEKQVTCENSFYDCGLTPEKVAKNSTNGSPVTKNTIGNKIDTGPSNTGSMVVNFPADNGVYTFDTIIMGILGYKDTELSFTNKSNCTVLRLYNKLYSDPAKALNALAVGNNKKAVILSGTNSLTLADKAGYLYYKSLGDKLIAYCYHLFCEQNSTTTKCLFTCDIFVAFFAYLFGNDFVYNENDKMPKITNVFYKTTVNYVILSRAVKTDMVKEYDDALKVIQRLLDKNSSYSFSGDNKTYNNRGFLDNVKTKLETFKDRLNSIRIVNPGERFYADMRKYKLLNLFNVQKSGDCIFITSRWQICVEDTEGFGNDDGTNKKRTLRSLSLSLGMTGGAIVRLDDDSLDVDGLPKSVYSKIPVEPKSGGSYYYDFLVEYNLFRFVTKAYTLFVSRLNAEDKVAINNYFDMTDVDVPYGYELTPPIIGEGTTTKASRLNPYVIYNNAGIDNVSELYNYGHIYDVMTYHFFAKPNYEDEYIINKIAVIIRSIGFSVNQEDEDYVMGEMTKISNPQLPETQPSNSDSGLEELPVGKELSAAVTPTAATTPSAANLNPGFLTMEQLADVTPNATTPTPATTPNNRSNNPEFQKAIQDSERRERENQLQLQIEKDRLIAKNNIMSLVDSATQIMNTLREPIDYRDIANRSRIQQMYPFVITAQEIIKSSPNALNPKELSLIESFINNVKSMYQMINTKQPTRALSTGRRGGKKRKTKKNTKKNTKQNRKQNKKRKTMKK